MPEKNGQPENCVQAGRFSYCVAGGGCARMVHYGDGTQDRGADAAFFAAP